MIDELYEEMMMKLKDMMKQSNSVSLTTDAAKMPTGDSYVAITGHWISSDWKLLSAVLAVSISNVSHTAEEIAALVQELGIKYTLDDRLDAIATDNGANFVAAMEDLLENGICEEHFVQKAITAYLVFEQTKTTTIMGLRQDLGSASQGSVISLEWLTSPQQCIIRQQLLVEMFAVAGVPSDDDEDRLCDESNMPKLTKRRRFEDCDFLDDYDDESTKSAVSDEQQCVCSSLRNRVKEEYDAWLRLSEIRSVDVMASLDPLEWWKMHNTQFPTIAKLARKYLAIPASSAPSERVSSRAKLIQERQRWSLLPQWLEASIMLKHNAWMLRKK
eukprot:Em0018g659a